ncbi:hypothetical protein [Cellulomonas sp. URHB0016]
MPQLPPVRRADATVTGACAARVAAAVPLVVAVLVALGGAMTSHPQLVLSAAVGVAGAAVVARLYGLVVAVAVGVLLLTGPLRRPDLLVRRGPARQSDPNRPGRARPRAPGASTPPCAA